MPEVTLYLITLDVEVFFLFRCVMNEVVTQYPLMLAVCKEIQTL